MASERAFRRQSAGEELANTISHGVGAVLAAIGAAVLTFQGAMSGSAKATFSLSLYGFTLVLLYTASAIYHGVRQPKAKRRLRVMDHCSIFLLILGTYTPLSLLVVGGGLGWSMFLINSVLAVIGITLNTIDLNRFDKLSLVLYAGMGWLVVIGLRTIAAALPAAGLWLLVAGGVSYTVGILFYKSEGKYMHFIWHLFVLAGSILQYACIALYCV